MHVIALVAGDAIARGASVRLTDVALLAGNACVQPDEREARHIVIEPDLVLPSRLGVTGRAFLAHRAVMDIIRLMAADAVLRQLRAANRAHMAGIAVELLVLAA